MFSSGPATIGPLPGADALTPLSSGTEPGT